ncbi:hypothetical protein SprV_0602209200 [Sparganum proliferum]
MPSSDTSSGSWSESDTDESMSSTSLANERSSSLEGTSVSTDEEVGSTAEVEEEDASPRESLRKWALRSKIPHSHLNDLLKALKPWLPDLPADARTLLGAALLCTEHGSGQRGYLPIVQMGSPLVPRLSGSDSDMITHSPTADIEKKRSQWTISGIKKLLLGQREMKAEMAALREEVRRLTASNSLPSAVEAPIVQRVSTLGGYDELTTDPVTSITDPTIDNGDQQPWGFYGLSGMTGRSQHQPWLRQWPLPPERTTPGSVHNKPLILVPSVFSFQHGV